MGRNGEAWDSKHGEKKENSRVLLSLLRSSRVGCELEKLAEADKIENVKHKKRENQ